MPTVSLPPGLKSQGAELRPLLALSAKNQAPRSPEFPTASGEQKTWELRAPTDPSGHPVPCQQLRGVSLQQSGPWRDFAFLQNRLNAYSMCMHVGTL